MVGDFSPTIFERIDFMGYVIKYDGGSFVLPKFDFNVIYDGGPSYIPTESALNEVLEKATQVPVVMSRSFFLNYINDTYRIGQSDYYRTSPPLKLTNGWDLYLHCAGGNSTTFFAYAYVLHNPTTGEVKTDTRGFSTTSSQLDLFRPIIFMFEDMAGEAFISYMTNDEYLQYGWGLSPSDITKGSYKTGEIFEILFPDGEVDTDDPYWQGDYSGTGGGGGDFNNTSTPIQIPELPSISATSTGFISLFNPSLAQLNELASYMWSNLFDIDGWKKLFSDPMDAILGLSILPVAVPSGGVKEVKVGNISTGISLTVASTQFVEVDCGSINVNEYWGAYLDYEPFTKAEIYLPYIGTHPISVDDIMGKSVHVVYHVDILSGACCAFVKCGDSVLYSFVGQCACSIPITGNNWTNVINGTLSVAASIGTMVATGGASAPMAAGTIASTAVNSMKPSVEKSGSMSGTGGILAVQTPYLILTRPNQALPEKQNTFTGYPSFITSKLGSLSGYTEIEEIHLENIPGTEQEISEIESLLTGGVII